VVDLAARRVVVGNGDGFTDARLEEVLQRAAASPAEADEPHPDPFV